MPKMKTHSGAKKRFKITATGRLKHKKAGVSHLLAHESRNHKRKLRGTAVVNKAQEKQVKEMLPYL